MGAVLGAGVLALTVAGPAAAQTDIEQIGYASPAVTTDYGWNEQGLVATQAAAEGVGAEVIVAEGLGYDDPAPSIRQLIDDGADFVVAMASGYNELAPPIAQETGVPVLVVDAPESVNVPGLVATANFEAHPGGYLAGVLAATMTESDVLGVVISASEDQNWWKAASGFVQGARSINPDVEFVTASISEFGYDDIEGGNRVTSQVIAAGADIVFGQGDFAAQGMFAAVEAADGVWFIDVIGDKTPIDEQGVLLSSVLWDFTDAFVQAAADVEAGTFGTQGYVLDIANGGIGLLETEHWTDEARDAVAKAAAGIADGSIELPDITTEAEYDALVEG
jgi:simple sugar transport system substrate-binding protein